MAIVRPNALPSEATPSVSDVTVLDGATTRKTTIVALVNSARPFASQLEAETGTDPAKAMSPLTTKQAIDEFAQPLNTNLTAWSALAPAAKQDASPNLTTLAGIVPGATGLAILADTTAAAVRAEIAAPGLAVANSFTETNVFTLTQAAAGDRIEITKQTTPANFATTKASLVLQHFEDNGGVDLPNGSKVDNVLFWFTDRTQGVTTSSTNSSVITGQGIRAFVDKQNDGSAHSFTVAGTLGPNGVDNAKVGANGYNEFGGFQALMTNVGSTNGNLSGVEIHLKDSPDAGVNSYQTRLGGIISAIAKYHTNTKFSANFHALNEGLTGSKDLDAILYAETRNNGAWTRGIDLYTDGSVSFTSGAAIRLPEPSSIQWTDGVTASSINTNNAGKITLTPGGNQVFIAATGALATPDIAKSTNANTGILWGAADDIQLVAGGVAGVRVLANNLQVSLSGGALKTVSEGAAGSAGTGFRQLRVPD